MSFAWRFAWQVVRLIWAVLRFLPAWFGNRLSKFSVKTAFSHESPRETKVAEPRSIVYRVNLNSGRYSRIDPRTDS